MVEVNISAESQAVDLWKKEFSAGERAAQYQSIFLAMMMPGTYEELRSLAPLLRYAVHADTDAKTYIAEHRDLFLPDFRLDYNLWLDTAVQANYAVLGKDRREMSIEERQSADLFPDIMVTADDILNNDLPTPTETGKVDNPDLLPVNEMRADFRQYMPFEETLGMNIWPLVGAIAATGGLFAAGVSIPALMSAAVARIGMGLAPIAKFIPRAYRDPITGKLDTAGKILQAGKVATGVNLALSSYTLQEQIIYNLANPHEAGMWAKDAIEERNMQQAREAGVEYVPPEDVEYDPDTGSKFFDETADDFASRLGRANVEYGAAGSTLDSISDKFAMRVNRALSQNEDPAPGISPVEQSQSYMSEADEVLGSSSAFPSDVIVPPRQGANTIVDPGGYAAEAGAYDEQVAAWAMGQQVYQSLLKNVGADQAWQWALTNFDPNQDVEKPEPPTPFIGAGWAGSPIAGPQQDINTGQWTNDSYSVARQDRQGRNYANPAAAGPWADEALIPVAPRYDEEDFSNIIGNMTPGQVDTFIEKGIAAGIIPDEYVGTGLMDGIISGAIQNTMYQANLSGDTWQVVLDKMIDAYAEAEEERKKSALDEWYNNFVPSTPYFDMDPDTIAQAVKNTMRNSLGREANQWEIDMMADGMRSDHRAAYDEQIAAERDVYNAVGRAQEYDEPQAPTGTYEAVDEDAGFAERFEERYETEIEQEERHQRVQDDTQNLFAGLGQLSRMGGGV